jgi:hypothetical protein
MEIHVTSDDGRVGANSFKRDDDNGRADQPGEKDPQWGTGMDCIKDEPLRGFESDLNGRLTFKRQGKGPGQLQPSSLARKAGQSGDTRRDKGHLGGNQRFMQEDGIGDVTGRTGATAYRRRLKLHCGSWPGRRRCGPRTNKSRRRRDWPPRDFG